MPRKGVQMNKSVLQRGIIFILCICILFSVCPVYAFAAENQKERVVRIGVPDDTYDKINENGKRSGYGYEYLQKIAGYTGWKYEYVDCTWENCFDKLKNDEMDIIEGISYTEERAENMLFSSIPMGDERYCVYVKPDNTDISSSDIASFNGKKIGVLMDYLPEMVLNEWEKKYDLHTQHVNVSNNEDALQKIANGEIDGFVSLEDSRLSGYGMASLTSIGSSKIYFAIAQSHSELKTELDNAMRRITDDDPYYADELHKQFLSVDSVYFLTGEEQKWLSEHGAIKIGYLINDGGVSTLDKETGKVSGLIMDYTQLAKNCLEGQTLKFDLGYELPTGKSAEMEFSSNKFATPLKNGTYKLCKKVHFNINPHFKLTSDSIVPTATGSMCGAFECRVLSSRSDSIRMIVINHTQNTCRLSGLPSILDAKTQNRHPLTRSGTTKAYEWMQANGQIMPGEGILLVIPTSWNLKDIGDAYKRSYYESGRLSEGVYSVSTLMEIELEAEFRLK